MLRMTRLPGARTAKSLLVLAWLLGRTLRRLIVSFGASRRQRDV